MSTVPKLCIFLISVTVLSGLNVSCSAKPVWIKPTRSMPLVTDVHKALAVAMNSSALSGYGPSAGILRHMLPRDLSDLDQQLANVDWSQEECIWTFDCAIEEISVDNSILKIRFAMEQGTGVRLWFFKGVSLRGIKEIEYE